MRLIYLAIPFVAVLLVACGDDERDTSLPTEPAPTTNDYNLPDEPASMPPADNTTMPPPADDGMGMGAERDPGTTQ